MSEESVDVSNEGEEDGELVATGKSDFSGENIRSRLIDEEIKDSYLTYAMSVIMSRALPDVRDGLKPSQRRVLVTLNDLSLGPRTKHKKCAKICGDCVGNYHPHGDQVVYPTLVRLAQDFSMRYPLVHGHGNFGSVDGDPAAAMRYTEARMGDPTTAMLEDLEKETVDYVPNYDESRDEPTVLPAKFPNLLVNGATGIAVGMATSIPPHNLDEVCEALIRLIDDRDVTIGELMEIVKGPDFPTGGIVCGRAGIRAGYKTGRGSVVIRSPYVIEELRGDRQQIVFTEIPYQVNKARLIEKIADLVREKKIVGISDIRDESNRKGMRIVVRLKRGEDPNVIVNLLYKYSQLQDTFSIIMIALVNMRPVTLNLRQMLEYHLEHRFEVITRRTRHLLDKAERRLHILHGLKIAVDNIDEVIKIIRASDSTEVARDRLMSRFGLTKLQADAILEMRLARLTGLEVEKLEAEIADVERKIFEYKAILADPALVYKIIREDLEDVRARYGDERRTKISDEELGTFNMEDLVAEESCVVSVSHAGYIKRMPVDTYRTQARGGKGVSSGTGTDDGDFIEDLFVANTHDYLLIFTDEGRLFWLRVFDIPDMKRTSRGRAIVNLLDLKGEKIRAVIPVRKFDDDRFVMMATKMGIIKKTELSAFARPQKAGIRALNFKTEGDTLVGVAITGGSDQIMLSTANGMACRFNEKDVRPMGRTAAGVAGIRLRQGDEVVGLVVCREKATILTVCENGYGKRSDIDGYRMTKRGAGGVINIKTTERNGRVVETREVHDDDQLMLISKGGMVVRIEASTLRTMGRATQGVRVINLKEGDRVVSVARVAPEDIGGGE